MDIKRNNRNISNNDNNDSYDNKNNNNDNYDEDDINAGVNGLMYSIPRTIDKKFFQKYH